MWGQGGILRRFVLFFATGFGLGYLPYAPGTFGSVVGAAFVWLLKDLTWLPYLATALTFAVFAAWISGFADMILKTKDNQKIVIDEIAGMLVTMALVPMTWRTLLAGFILFRLFDIWKPFPVRLIQDRVPGGWGVVGDDVLAGVYANFILQILIRWVF